MVPAVQGCTIQYSISGGTVSVTGTVANASSKCKSGNNQLYRKELKITVSAVSVVLLSPPAGASSTTGTGVGPFSSFTISASTEKTSDRDENFVCEGDADTQSFKFMFPQASGPNPISVDIDVTAKVSSANQNVVKAT